MKEKENRRGKGAGGRPPAKKVEVVRPPKACLPQLTQFGPEQATLAAIMDATDVMLVYLDREFNFLRVNAAYAASCGMTPNEMVGQNHFALYPHPENEAIFRRVRDTGEPVFFKDKPFEFPDQPERGVTYWDWSLAPVKDQGGEVQGLVFSLRETTRYKQAELALAASESRFRDMAETSRDLIFQMDLRSRITYVSPALRYYGYSQLQVVGEMFMKFVPAAELPKAFEILRRITAGEKISLSELQLLRSDGVPVVCEISATPIMRAGAVVGVQGVVRDISERKRTEVELHRLNHVLKALGDSRRAMILAGSEAEYLDEVCRIVVEDCGFRMVWIGYAEEDAARTVRPVAQAGLGSDYLESVRITWGDGELGRGPTGTAIRTGRPAMCRDMLTDPAFAPWREQAVKRGYASSLVLPLSGGGEVFGALTIYATEPDGFAGSEVKLLTELAEDMAYGILALREKTAREAAEAALRRSEAQLQAILNSITEGLVVAGLDGELIYWNPAAVAMHGYGDAAEGRRLLGSLADTFEVSDQTGRVLAVDEWPLARILRGETLLGLELRVRRLDHDWQRVFGYSGTIARDSLGHPVLAVVVVSDVTERKRAEEALLRAKHEWELTFDAVPDLIAILDTRHRIVRANRAMAERLGMSPEECLGESCFSCVHGASGPPSACPHARTMRDGRQHEAELHEERLGGDFLVTTTPLFADDGRMIGSVHVSRDITERKRAEEERERLLAEVQRNALELDTVFRALPYLVSIHGRDGRYLRVNPAIVELFGFDPTHASREEIAARVRARFPDGTPLTPLNMPSSRALKGETVREVEYLLTDDRGEEHVLLVNAIPLLADGVVYGTVLAQMDITERKRNEEKIGNLNQELKESLFQFDELTRELERSNHDLQQFAYIASHDLQGPLHTVASFLQLLERRYRGQLDDKALSYINYAVDGSAYMQRLLVDLLAFSRVGGGKLNLRPVNLSEVAGRVVDNLRKGIADQGAEVVVDPSLPVVVADESQMLHLLQNLIANAIKFRGEDPPRVEVFAEKEAGLWRICVRDNGIGIDPRFAERIFLIFQRLHKREEYGGTGIGLAICKKIVERHGGRIWVESQPGHGATFCFSLPEVTG